MGPQSANFSLSLSLFFYFLDPLVFDWFLNATSKPSKEAKATAIMT